MLEFSAKIRCHHKFSGQPDQAVIELIYEFAPLHDVGKTETPDPVLFKSGQPTNKKAGAVKSTHQKVGLPEPGPEPLLIDPRFIKGAVYA